MNHPFSFQLALRLSISRRVMRFLLLALLTLAGLVLLSRSVASAPVYVSSDDPLILDWWSFESEGGQTVAWGDYDGDGDLDLAVGTACLETLSGASCYPSRLYRNDSAGDTIMMTLAWVSADTAHTKGVAWGDVDNDGDLDLALGNDCIGAFPETCHDNWLYRNDGGVLTTSPVYAISGAGYAQDLAWGDYDGDGDLDLAVVQENYQPNRVYSNNTVGSVISMTLAWSSTDYMSSWPTSVAWGDYDRDSDLDLIIGNDGPANQLYRNDGGTLTPSAVWTSFESDGTESVAWGDVDNDGDLDLAVGNDGRPNRLYRNLNGTLDTSAIWSASITDTTKSVAWGDYDGDGDLDLAVGNDDLPNRLYLNDGGTLDTTPAWSSPQSERTLSVAWGDYGGGGGLDLAVGNDDQPSRLYRNNVGPLAASAVWVSAESKNTHTVAWGDYDGDGDLDLAVGDSIIAGAVRLYHNDGGILGDSTAFSITVTGVRSIAWGDYDGDGDLDLAVAGSWDPTYVYRNDDGTLTASPVYTTDETNSARSIAWSDYDGDGDLDLTVGNYGQPTRLYVNTGNMLAASAVYSTETHYGESVAWGDYDGDGDLDLFIGTGAIAHLRYPNLLYRNEGGTLTARAVYSTTETDNTKSVAWGDYDGDGDLDLAVGNGGGSPNRLYRNDGGILTPQAVWTSIEGDNTTSVAWGDYDGDGDLDLIAGNYDHWEENVLGYVSEPNRVYRNDGGMLGPSAAWTAAEPDKTTSVAWGDYDGDGDLDLVVGNDDEPNRLYRNGRDGRPLPGAVPTVYLARLGPNADFYSDPQIWDETTIPITYTLYDLGGAPVKSIRAWYSPDGGGRWLPAVAASGTMTTNLDAHHVLLEDFEQGLPPAGWSHYMTGNPGDSGWLKGMMGTSGSHGAPNSGAYYAWHNYDMLGSPAISWLVTPRIRVPAGGQLTFWQRDYWQGSFYFYHGVWVTTGNDPDPTVSTYVEVWSGDTGASWVQQTVDLSAYAGQDIYIAFLYAGDNADEWYIDDVIVTSSYVYKWDTFASGFFGRSDNVVFRIEAAPTIITGTQNATPGPYLHGTYAAHTFPFRVRGTQIRVMSDTLPVAGALVYRLPGDQTRGGLPIVNSAGVPFVTDSQGYLQGRGELEINDHLFAMVPVTWTESYTLYYTSGSPTLTGVNAYTVTRSGVHTLTVSSQNPLILFNLDVSLEWDSHNDAAYLDQLQFNLQRASEYLYDFTNGQVALGDVDVFQNGDEWVYSHVVVQANNRLRPFAIQGGIVSTDTIDPQHNTVSDTIRYSPGQVTMGSTWNRYGNPGQSLGEDWPVILAHELSHYLLFHDDTYIGLNADGFLVPISTCLGSAMGDLYDKPDNTEFIADEDYWQANCADTLAERTLERNEWETMDLWYPWLVTPTVTNSGPSIMPFDLTTVRLHDPYTPTDAFEDPTFYIDYQGGGGSSSEARAYLDRGEYVVNLGSPFGGQNRVIAYGAKPDDRLCVFDRPRAQFGCETIEFGDDRLTMRRDTTWSPIVLVSPINSTTLTINVTNSVPIAYPLRARIFPDLGYGEDPITLTLSEGIYTGTFTLTYPAMSGNIQVWVDEPYSETDPRREVMVALSIGGNPGMQRGAGGMQRGAGGMQRGAGGMQRGAGGMQRGAGAPIVSPDGQMIFFTENPIDFAVGTFFTIQGMAGLPPLPPGRTLVGQGYNLVASPGVTLPTGSVSIQYLSNDVFVAGADESDLTLYYWDGASWTALNTVLDTYFNLASAPSQGEGVYALMASIKIPLYGPGWNLFAYSVHATQPVSQALLSIQGYYTTVYGYEPTDTTDPWKVYDTGVPTYVNDLEALEFGKGYWINVSQAITLHLASSVFPMAADVLDAATMPLPPATFYGAVLPGSGFAPVPGMAVTAWIDGHRCGQAETMAVGGQAVYAVNVLAEGDSEDDRGTAAGCGAPGREVTFVVGSRLMVSKAAWDISQLWEVTLQPGWPVYLPLVVKG